MIEDFPHKNKKVLAGIEKEVLRAFHSKRIISDSMIKVFPRKNKKVLRKLKPNQHDSSGPHFVGKVLKVCRNNCCICEVYGFDTCVKLRRIK